MQEHPSSTLSFKIKQEIVQIVESQKYSEAGFMILEAFVFPLLHQLHSYAYVLKKDVISEPY